MAEPPKPQTPISLTASVHHGHVGRWLFVAAVAIVLMLFFGARLSLTPMVAVAIALLIAWTVVLCIFIVIRTRQAKKAAVEILTTWPPEKPLALHVRVPLVGKTLMTRYSLGAVLTIRDGWVLLSTRKPLIAPARTIQVGDSTPFLNIGIGMVFPTGPQRISLVVEGLELHLAQLIDHALAEPLSALVAAHAAAHSDVTATPPPGMAPPPPGPFDPVD
jgi:hypothetical protein